jgi:hypothetical protein
MQTFRTEAVLSQDGILTVRGVPFRTGEKVEVIILRLHHRPVGVERYPLRGKPIRYLAPYESVAEDDWNALQ